MSASDVASQRAPIAWARHHRASATNSASAAPIASASARRCATGAAVAAVSAAFVIATGSTIHGRARRNRPPTSRTSAAVPGVEAPTLRRAADATEAVVEVEAGVITSVGSLAWAGTGLPVHALRLTRSIA